MFQWQKRHLCGVGEEAHSRHRCKPERCLHPSSTAAQEGGSKGPMADYPAKGKLRPVGTVRGGYNSVRGGRPSVDGRSLTAFT